MSATALNSTDDTRYAWCKIEPFFGHVHIESRMRLDGHRFIGESRARHFDKDGKMVKDSGWEPTGIVLTWPEPEPRRWWEFWK